MSKLNYRLNQKEIEYYDKQIQEAENRLKKAQKKYIDGRNEYKLINFINDLKKQKEIKKYRVFNNRLWYDYPIEYNDYIIMVKRLSKTTIILRRLGYFKGKRVSSYDDNIGNWDTQAALTSRNMRELSGGIKKSWRRARWKYLPNDKDIDNSGAPYIYKIRGKKYLAHNMASLKKYIENKKR